MLPKPLPHRMRRKPNPNLTDEFAVNLVTGGRLQTRDMALLNFVWQMGSASASQLRRTFFHTVKNPVYARNAANRRLKWLFETYCLNRTIPGHRAEALYYLDNIGARLIRMEKDVSSLRDIGWASGDIGRYMFKLPHTLGITETVVQLIEAGRAHNFAVDWVPETALSLALDEKFAFVPDGLARLTHIDGGKLAFFLEWDEATESLNRIAEKIRRYHQYARREQLWHADFERIFPDYGPPSKFPPLIFITTGGTKRLGNMLKIALAVQQKTFNKTLAFPVLMTNRAQINKTGIWGETFFTPEMTATGDFAWQYVRTIVSILKSSGGTP